MPAFSLALFLVLAPAADVSASIRQGLDYCYRQEYDSAAATVAPLLSQRPADPAGWFWQASLVQMLVYDAGDAGLVDSFYGLSAYTLRLCREALARNPDDANALFYYGMTQLNRGRMLSWRQDRMGAIRAVLDVPGHLRAAVKRDTGLADAWFGIGISEYALSMVGQYLPGGATKAQAYSHVRRAGRDGVNCRPMADFALAWMFAQDKKRDSAVAWCRTLLDRYPGNRTALRLLRDVYYNDGDYVQVLQTGRELDADISAAFQDDKYARAENWLKMAQAWAQLGGRDSAVALADRILAWQAYRDEVPWLPNYLRNAADLKRRLAR